MVAIATVAGLMITACSSSSATKPSTRSTTTPRVTGPLTGTALTDAVIGAQPTVAAESAAFIYEKLPPSDLVHRIGRAMVVVAGPQNESAAAAAQITRTGAQAFRYVQTYWFPSARALDGLDMSAHPEFAFCREGFTPAAGRTDSDNVTWWFLDMNEREVQEFYRLRFEAMKQAGWTGVFFDRGFASLTGIDAENYDVWTRVSSCTQDPVLASPNFAESYLSIVALARRAGLKTMFNYGVSPFDLTTPLRPDARNVDCQRHLWSSCPHLDDAWPITNWVLDEAPSHQRDLLWDRDFATNRANEQDADHGGQVIGLLTSNLLQSDDRNVAYYEWARARLFSFPLGINTGDGGCPTTGTPCNRRGFHPELASVTVGNAVDPQPVSHDCDPGNAVRCWWIRRSSRGAVVVNVGDTPKTASWTLDVGGCRYLLDVRAGQALADGRCVTMASVSLDAWSGGPIQYSTQPF